MPCQSCDAKQVVSVSAKCSDLCLVNYPDGNEHRGYVPDDLVLAVMTTLN